MNIRHFLFAVALSTVSCFGVAFLCVSATLAQSTQPPTAATSPQQFVGTWRALHKGTPILVLELHLEKDKLAGGIRVCGFTINTEDNGQIVEITNPAFSDSLPIRNIVVSEKSLSFDWTDPDGDENHLKFELTGTDAGKVNWVGLPNGLKIEPIAVTKDVPKKS